MKLINIRDDKKYLPAIFRLYKSAFPYEERAPFLLLLRRTRRDGFDLLALEEDGRFAGLMYTVRYRDILYIFYLAVAEERRGKGLGSGALRAIRDQNPGRRVILNIEEVDPKYPNYEQRVTRLRFYERNGFRPTDLNTLEYGVVYTMLESSGYVSREEYYALMTQFFGEKAFRKIFREL